MKNSISLKLQYVVILIALNTILYIQSLHFDFIWDDRSLILQNQTVQNPSKIIDAFKTTIKVFGEDYGFYRPITIITYTIDNLIWNGKPFGFHLSNIIIHILVVINIFYLISWLFNLQKGFFASLIFTTFAAHIENVVFISGRMDSLATLFMLFALNIYFTSKTPVFLKLSVFAISLFFAILSKEIAYIFPFIFILLVLFKYPRAIRITHFKIGGSIIVVIFIFYFLLKSILIKSILAPPHSGFTFLQRIIMIPQIIVFYLQILLFPFNLNARHYHFLFNSIQLEKLIIAVIILMVLIFLLLRVKKNRQILLGSLWFITGLIPVLNIFPLSGMLVAERFLYFPSIGIAILLVGFMPDKLSYFFSNLKNALASLIFLFIFISNVVFTLLRIPIWSNEEKFFTKMITQNPDAPLGYHNLGHFYYRQGIWDKAEQYYKKAISINPYFPAPHASLGDLYVRIGKYKEAINEYKIYLKLSPNATNRNAVIIRIGELERLLYSEPEE
ncbi:MAG: tetratricopeptide repeat protein [candidate division WOR-3 bacterium]